MLKKSSLFALTLLSLSIQEVSATNYTWNSALSGNWGLASDWSPATIPNGEGNNVTFGTVPSSPLNIFISNGGAGTYQPTVSQIIFNANTTYTLTPDPSTGLGQIILQNPSSLTAYIETVDVQSHLINVPIHVKGTDSGTNNINFFADNGSTLTFEADSYVTLVNSGSHGTTRLQFSPGVGAPNGTITNLGKAGDGSGGKGFGFNNSAVGTNTNAINIYCGPINNGRTNSGDAVFGQGSTINFYEPGVDSQTNFYNENGSTLGGSLGSVAANINVNCLQNAGGSGPTNYHILNGYTNAATVGSSLTNFTLTAGKISNLTDSHGNPSTFICSTFNLATGAPNTAYMLYNNTGRTIIVNQMTAGVATALSPTIQTGSGISRSTVGYGAIFQTLPSNAVNLQLNGHTFTNTFASGANLTYSGSPYTPCQAHN